MNNTFPSLCELSINRGSVLANNDSHTFVDFCRVTKCHLVELNFALILALKFSMLTKDLVSVNEKSGHLNQILILY